jgi:23S rRNA (adenine2503-C2)-methyltransferase
MPSTGESLAKPRFFDLGEPALTETVRAWGWPAFRAGQLMDWVYGKLVVDPEQMTNLSKRDRDLLKANFDFSMATVARQQTSSDGTIKLLLTWPDGKNAETVMIPDADRRTACMTAA